jgi:transposase
MVAVTDENTVIAFDVVPGQCHDAPLMEPLLDQVAERLPNMDEVVMDKAFSGEPQRQACVDRNLAPQVPNKSNAVDPWPFDQTAYKERNRVERLFCKTKSYRRIATRYEKLKGTFIGLLHLVFGFIAFRAS